VGGEDLRGRHDALDVIRTHASEHQETEMHEAGERQASPVRKTRLGIWTPGIWMLSTADTRH
jgi:hypothetical protein